MGLDTSHDCWHGPYSMFMRYREDLHRLIVTDRYGMGNGSRTLEEAWANGDYDDQSDPLNVFMSHSDCDGEIAAEVCGPLADALEGLMERRMPARAYYDIARPATERWIAGLRRAAQAGESVRFG